jgi:glycosyltransferase involved in cell wall biosynthesis
VEFLKKRLEQEGHQCVVLNIGTSRRVPSTEYETVRDGPDFIRKLWRYSRQEFTVHAHANGDSLKGVLLAVTAELINLMCGRRCYLTFHAGVTQRHFPRERNRWLIPAFWALFAIPQRIICNSDAVKTCIFRYGVSPRKIVAIPAFSRQYLEFQERPLAADIDALFHRFPSVVFTYVRMRPLFYPLILIQGMANVFRRRPDVGLIVVGGKSHADAGVWEAFRNAIEHEHVEDRICLVDDLDHDGFLTVLKRSSLYLRTPITDGVASSVLEALVLGVPVVACDNGTRPPGVITYPATDAARLAAAVEDVLDRRSQIIASCPEVDVRDTVADEVAVLTRADVPSTAGRRRA